MRGVNSRRPERGVGPAKEIRLDYKPHPKQNIFHSIEADVALYGGAAGGGKTMALLMDALVFVVERPGSTAMIMRRTYPELEGSVIKTSLEKFPREFCRYNSAKHQWTIATGIKGKNSYVHFGHCESEADVYKWRSAEWQYLGLDESTSFTQEMFGQLLTRVRSSIPGAKCKVRLCTNPGQLGHCVAEGEVLTPSGWKDIRDFSVGDSVFTVEKNGDLCSARVDQVHKRKYDGELVQVRANSLFMEMTPNHSVAKLRGLRGETRGDKFSLVPWEDLPGQAYIFRSVNWGGTDPERFVLPAYRPKRRPRLELPDSLPWRDYAEFMGWFLAEGYTVSTRRCFGISQCKPHNRVKIDDLLRRCGFPARWCKTSANVHSAKWWNYLRQFGRCRDKHVPTKLKGSSVPILRVFFDAAMAGDGHWGTPGKSGAYFTISKRLADDMAEIAVKLGYLVRVKERQRENRDGLTYEIFFTTVKNGSTEILTGQHVYDVKTRTIRRSDVSRVRYKGPVYCLGIAKTHSFVIRQKGTVWISGNSWHRKYFDIGAGGHKPLEVWRPNKSVGDKYDPPTRVYIPATIFDNPALLANDPGYLARLEALPEAQKRMLLYGDWEGFSGQFFAEFNRGAHMIQPIVLPRHWKLYRSVDFGFDKPFSAHWHAIADNGHCYTYREVYKKGLRDKQQAQLIKDVSVRLGVAGSVGDPEPIEYTVGDPSQVVRGKDTGITTQQNYHEIGIPIFPGSNARVPGWSTMRNWLAIDPATGTPWWQIFNTCPELIRELEEAIYDPNRAEDVDSRGSDHAIDECRYFFMSRPAPSRGLTPVDPAARLDPSSRLEWAAVAKMQDVARAQAANKGPVLGGFND